MEITEEKSRRQARARRNVVTNNQVEKGSMKGLRSKRTPKTSTTKRAPNSRKAERKRTKSKDSKRTPSTKVQSSKRTPEATATNIRAEEIRKGSDLRRKKS